MPRQTIIIYFADPSEGYSDLKKFCKVKGLKYNTWARKKLPIEYKGFTLERIPVEGQCHAVEHNGNLIKIQ